MTPRPLRVGSVPYLVGRPLDLGLEQEPGIELVRDIPARLVEGLRSGELDVALVSSIELFRRPGYRFLPGLAVSGRGTVASVQVFLRKPLSELQTLALDPSSRTAATLVQVLLARRPEGAPRFVEVPAGDDPREAGCDGWLRIGDPALRELWVDEPPKFWNPSREWTETTGLPFVFAPWIVAPGVDIEPHLAAFARSRLVGERALGELALRAADDWQLPRHLCTSYLAEECVYEPGPDMRAALRAFRDGAAPLGLCEADLDPAPVEAFRAHLA